MTPGSNDLWFLPLGGCGEIGINLNLYGHAGQWLIVDCGIGFERTPGVEAVIAPEPDFIATRKQHLAGMVITHAHEDHVGAVPYLWPELGCPVYCTPFTAAVLRRKLSEAGLLEHVPLHVVMPGSQRRIGQFELKWMGVTHSTPESQCLLIETSAGRILHTGDWKWDNAPQLGEAADDRPFRELASVGIDALVCDSTCATIDGRTPSEGDLITGLNEVIKQAAGRVVVVCFGSNIARLQTLATIGANNDREVALFGRSLDNNHRAAQEAGLWDPDLKFIHPGDTGYLPRDKLLIIASGSQGESRAALARLAAGTHRDLDLEPGDTVVLSSRVIPGNEEAFDRVRQRFLARDIAVIEQTPTGPLLHASGHPARDELTDMYRWVQPSVSIPVHGEPHHLEAHAALAKQVGVPRQLLGRNGDLFLLAPVPGIRRSAVTVGRRIIRQSG